MRSQERPCRTVKRPGAGRVSGVFGRRVRLAKGVLGGVGLVYLCVIVVIVGTRVGDLSRSGDWLAADWLDAAYLGLQMLYANGSDEATKHPVLSWLRLFVAWTLPLAGVIAVVSAVRIRLGFAVKHILWRLFGRWLHWPASLQRDLVLVIGLGQKGLEMVRAEVGSSSVVVIEPNPDNPRIVQAEALGAVVWVGDGRSRNDLRVARWKLPRKVWIMTGESRRNLLILQLAKEVYEEPGARPREVRVDIHAHIEEFKERRDAAVLNTLNKDGSGVWTHLFNQDESCAEWLIRTHPVRPTNDGRPPRILLIGLGPLGRAIFRELLLMCHFTPAQPAVRILTYDNTDADVHLREELPFLDTAAAQLCDSVEWSFRREDAQAWTCEHYFSKVRSGEAFTHVFICMGSEVRNLALAERMWGWEAMAGDEAAPAPAIVPIVYDEEAEGWSAVGSGQRRKILPFKLGAVYTPEALQWRNVQLRELAERINRVHGETADWETLREDDRRSSMAQARYLFNRFHRHGGQNGVADSWIRTLPKEEAGDSLRRLDEESRCEHRRWNAFMLVENFGAVTPGPRYGAEVEDPSDPSGKKLKLRKVARVNRNLVPFDELDDSFKQKDADFVEQHEWIKQGGAEL